MGERVLSQQIMFPKFELYINMRINEERDVYHVYHVYWCIDDTHVITM